jgi:4'-phosphopantetheinyl transferase
MPHVVGSAGRRPLGPGEVHVWLVAPPRESDADVAQWATLLSDEERLHVARHRFERHRREAAVSRALVRATLAEYIDRDPSTFRYQVGAYGRPSLEPPEVVHFNASNHPGLVACAVSLHAQIGVDLEPLSRGAEILEVAATVFSAPERTALAALSPEERADRAVSLWTCKEAYIKAVGLGFSASLLDIVVELPEHATPTLRFLSGVDDPTGWRLATRDVDGFRVAVAVRTDAADVDVVVRKDWLAPG